MTLSPERMRYARTPDTVCLLLAMSGAGLVLTIAGYIPASVEAIAPTWGGTLWGAVLAVSSGLALVGVLTDDLLLGWALEASGRPGVAITCAGYAIAVGVGMGDNFGAALAVVVFGSIAIASGVRTWQLWRRWRQFRAAMEAMEGEK